MHLLLQHGAARSKSDPPPWVAILAAVPCAGSEAKIITAALACPLPAAAMEGSVGPHPTGVRAAQPTLEAAAALKAVQALEASCKTVLCIPDLCCDEISSSLSTSGSSSGQSSRDKAQGTSTTSSSCTHERLAVGSDPGSSGKGHRSIPYSWQEETQDEDSAQYDAPAVKQTMDEMLSNYSSSCCSGSCRCAADASNLLQMVRHSKLFQSEQHRATALPILSEPLSALAAKLLEPAAGHKLVAAQDVLQVFTE